MNKNTEKFGVGNLYPDTDPSIFWSNSLDYLKKNNISYVCKIIKTSSELNLNLIDELEKLFEEESVDAPFCNIGDVDLDDLENNLPVGWTLKKVKSNLKPGDAMVVLSVIDYSAKRYFDVKDFKNVEIVAYDLGGIYPLSVNSSEDPFLDDYQTFAKEKKLSLVFCEEEDSLDTWSCCSVEKFDQFCEDWKDFIKRIKSS